MTSSSIRNRDLSAEGALADDCGSLKRSDGGFLARRTRPSVVVVRYREEGIAGTDQRRTGQGVKVRYLAGPIRPCADEPGITPIHPTIVSWHVLAPPIGSGHKIVPHDHVGQRWVDRAPTLVWARRIVTDKNKGVIDHLRTVRASKLAVVEIDNKALGRVGHAIVKRVVVEFHIQEIHIYLAGNVHENIVPERPVLAVIEETVFVSALQAAKLAVAIDNEVLFDDVTTRGEAIIGEALEHIGVGAAFTGIVHVGDDIAADDIGDAPEIKRGFYIRAIPNDICLEQDMGATDAHCGHLAHILHDIATNDGPLRHADIERRGRSAAIHIKSQHVRPIRMDRVGEDLAPTAAATEDGRIAVIKIGPAIEALPADEVLPDAHVLDADVAASVKGNEVVGLSVPGSDLDQPS